MEDEPSQEIDGESDPMQRSSDRIKEDRKGPGWIVWVLVIMIAFLLGSSIANLVVSQRAYESSRKQVKAMEQLTRSIQDIQRSIANLARMIDQSSQEDEEPGEEREEASGDGSI